MEAAGKARSAIASRRIEKADENSLSCWSKAGTRVGAALFRIWTLVRISLSVRVIAESAGKGKAREHRQNQLLLLEFVESLRSGCVESEYLLLSFQTAGGENPDHFARSAKAWDGRSLSCGGLFALPVFRSWLGSRSAPGRAAGGSCPHIFSYKVLNVFCGVDSSAAGRG